MCVHWQHKLQIVPWVNVLIHFTPNAMRRTHPFVERQLPYIQMSALRGCTGHPTWQNGRDLGSVLDSWYERTPSASIHCLIVCVIGNGSLLCSLCCQLIRICVCVCAHCWQCKTDAALRVACLSPLIAWVIISSTLGMLGGLFGCSCHYAKPASSRLKNACVKLQDCSRTVLVRGSRY